VETDDYLETSVDGVWAIGDVAGNYMFKHSGDKEGEYVVENAIRGNHEPVEYPGMAHAIFGSPQLASLGKPESKLDEGVAYTVGTREYDDVPLGSAMQADHGFAKVLVGQDDEVLGVHVVGPDASTLIHEVSTAVAAGADARGIAETIHVHPALSEVVQGRSGTPATWRRPESDAVATSCYRAAAAAFQWARRSADMEHDDPVIEEAANRGDKLLAGKLVKLVEKHHGTGQGVPARSWRTTSTNWTRRAPWTPRRCAGNSRTTSRTTARGRNRRRCTRSATGG